MRVSLVVPTRDKGAYLALTLPALLAAAAAEAPGLCEVIVVDDGSVDDTPARLAALAAGMAGTHDRAGDPTLRVLRLAGVGLAAARNAGAAVAGGAQLGFLDDDVLVAPGALGALLAAAARRPAAVHVGRLRNVAAAAVAPRLAAGAPPAVDVIAASCTGVPMYDAVAALYDGAPGIRRAVWWAVVTGGNLMVPRAAFLAAGGFDEGFRGWGPEDADLCYRLFRAGVDAELVDDAALYHLDHPRDRRAATDAMVRNAAHFLKKHGKPRDLLDYLQFTNGTLSLHDFNARVADRHQLPAPPLPDFRLDFGYVTARPQFLVGGRT